MTELPEMPCRELVEQVTAYLEGVLDPVDTLRLEAHLGQCEACALYIEQLRTTLHLVGRLEPEELSEAARRDLTRAFAAWAAERE